MKYVVRILTVFLLSIVLISCSDKDSEVDDTEETTEQDNQQEETTDEEDASKTPSNDLGIESGEGGFLWRVDNGETTVYLQGTVHLGIEDFYPLNEKIEQAYEESDVVVPEVDITDTDLSADLDPSAMNAMYMDGTTIKDHISEDVYDQLEEFFTGYNMPMDVVESFKPWMLESLVMQIVAEQLDYMHGVDEYFLERATKDDKEIVELETAAEQLEVLSSQSDEFQEIQLAATLEGADNFDKEMGELFVAYLDGDEDRLLDLLFAEEEMDEEIDEKMLEEYEEYMFALNDERNVGMAEKIQGFLEEDSGQTYFVIVGTAHLIMDPHIRTLLEEEGYDVERVY